MIIIRLIFINTRILSNYNCFYLNLSSHGHYGWYIIIIILIGTFFYIYILYSNAYYSISIDKLKLPIYNSML